jgi:TfoX/Sxy family transcriptional regulator of competence genes
MGRLVPNAPADILDLYERLVATNPRVERKGATMPYTSLNGHMFSFLTKTGTLALRLATEERDAFLKRYKTKLCEQHGTVLKEYVEVPDALLKETQELKKYFDLSYRYVASLKPKPTKKKPGKKRQTEHTGCRT